MARWYMSCHVPDEDVLNFVCLNTIRCLLADQVDASFCREGVLEFFKGYSCIDWNVYVFYVTCLLFICESANVLVNFFLLFDCD